MKRSFDIIVTFIGLILLMPLFVLLGLIVYLNDKGPIFFKQMRVGKGGRMFTLYKLRSMSVKKIVTEGSSSPEIRQG